MAAGEGVMREGRHIHLYTMEQAQNFNTSHTINQLSFGEPNGGMNPLDRTSRIIDEGVVIIRCFLYRGSRRLEVQNLF